MSLFLVALAFAVFAASALGGALTSNGAFQLSGSLTSGNPVVTNPAKGSAGRSCSNGDDQFAATDSGMFRYKTYTFRNINAFAQCVTVNLLVSSGEAIAQAYRGTYNATNPFTNFIGDSFVSLTADETIHFGFSAAGCYCATPNVYTIVVREADVFGPAAGATYTLLVEGTGIILTGGGPTAAASIQSFRASSGSKGVVVHWRTRAEPEAIGFNVYRGDVKKVRLTRSIVRASGGGRGHSYSYVDRMPKKGKAGRYWLEIVQRSGSKIMFGPALRTAR